MKPMLGKGSFESESGEDDEIRARRWLFQCGDSFEVVPGGVNWFGGCSDSGD